MTAGPVFPALAASAIRQALVPMAAFYLIFMGVLAAGLVGLHRRSAGWARSPGETSTPGPAPGASWGWLAFSRHVLVTAMAGYLLLIAVAVAYYYGVARAGGAFLSSVLTGPALLIGLSMPVFAAASWMSSKAHGRSGKLPAKPSRRDSDR